MRFSASAMLMLVMTTSALAAPPGDTGGTVKARSNSSDDVIDPLQDTRFETCVQLMKRAYYMADPRGLERALDAHREMELARDAFQNGDQAACERHAAQALDDRT